MPKPGKFVIVLIIAVCITNAFDLKFQEWTEIGNQKDIEIS